MIGGHLKADGTVALFTPFIFFSIVKIVIDSIFMNKSYVLKNEIKMKS